MADETYIEEGPEGVVAISASGTSGADLYEEEAPAGDPFYPWPEPCPDVTDPDTTPPVVTFVSPPEGTQVEVNDALVFDVTDETELGRVLVVLYIAATADQELAFDGTSFTARYLALSSVTPISGGLRFSLRRTGGWTAATNITVRVFAVDGSGNLET